MEFFNNIPSIPSLSTLKKSLTHQLECLQNQLVQVELLQAVETVQLAVAGLVIVVILILVVAFKKFKRKPNKEKINVLKEEEPAKCIPKPKWKKPDTIGHKIEKVKEEPKTWKKPLGVRNTKEENSSSLTSNKWKSDKADILNDVSTPKSTGKLPCLTVQTKPLLIKEEVKSNRETKNDEPIKTDEKVLEVKAIIVEKKETKREIIVHKRQLIQRPERDEKKEAEDFEKELKEEEKRAEAEAKRYMKPINLNIDKNARPIEESKKNKDKELNLVRKLCGEFREVAKGDENEEKQEKRKEMEKVRSARSYFKTVDKYRSESMSAVPRMRVKSEEDFNDRFNKGSHMRLSQFEPGKINRKFTSIFGGDDQNENQERQRPPKKKLITLDQVMKKSIVDDDELTKLDRKQELEELKQARKNWVPPQENTNLVTDSKAEIESFSRVSSTPLKSRWNPVSSDRQEKTRSMEVPQKLNMENLFSNTARDDSELTKISVEKELNEIRESRPTPLAKRWKPKQYQKSSERSQSAHPLQRAKLADNSWVVEKSESRLEEEKKKALNELEFVKKARMETLEVIESSEVERSSSRQEMQAKFETRKELEEIKKIRTETKSYEPHMNEEVPNYKTIGSFDDVLEKQTVENMEKSKLKTEGYSIETSEVKCVRFNETTTEKEISVEKNTDEDDNKLENKVKMKLKQFKQQTEKEVSKFTSKKSKSLQTKETERERASRAEEKIDSPENNTSTPRSRSLSRIKSAGQKVKDLTNEQIKKMSNSRPKKNAKA